MSAMMMIVWGSFRLARIGRQVLSGPSSMMLLSGILAAAFNLVTGDRALAQVLTIPDEVICAECEIEVEPLAEIPGSGVSVGFPVIARLRPVADGEWLIGPTYEPGELEVWSSDGRLLRTMGRQGDGPGEFLGRFNHLERADDGSLHIFESNRHSVLDPSTGEVTTQRLWPQPPDGVLVLDTGRFVVNAAVSTYRPTTGDGVDGPRPLHLTDRNGDVLDSYGPVEERGYYALASGEDARFWAAPRNQYSLTLRDTSGRVIRRIRREPTWFQGSSDLSTSPLRERPPPRITAIHMDPAGWVWVVVAVADSAWSPTHPEGGGEVRIDRASFVPDEIYDTVVEIISPRAGRIVARRRFDQAFSVLLEDRVTYHKVAAPAGGFRIRVVRLILTQEELDP